MLSLLLRHIAVMYIILLPPFCAGSTSGSITRSEMQTDFGKRDATLAQPPDGQAQPFREGDLPDSPWGFRIGDRVIIPPRFGYASDFREGLARVWVQIDAMAQGEEPPRFRWGFIDSAGTYRVAPRFTAASEFLRGRVLVQYEDEFFFVDRSGSIVGPLAGEADAGPLPLPTEDVRSLEQYAAGLDLGVPFETMLANPIQGERVLTVLVRPLRYGAIEVVECGWEGQSRLLILPDHSLDKARVIVQQLLAGREYRDVTANGLFSDDIITYELVIPDSLGEFIGIRRRPTGGLSIHHTHWSG